MHFKLEILPAEFCIRPRGPVVLSLGLHGAVVVAVVVDVLANGNFESKGIEFIQ